MDGVIGFTTLFAGSFAPRNWALCNGALIQIRQNTALFSIIGTVFGGDGVTTFGLPDLRGRMVIGTGQTPGLSVYTLGQSGGIETTTLNQQQMASHSHPTSVTITPAAATNASSPSPVSGVYANGTEQLYNSTADTFMQSYQALLTMGLTGNSVPFSIVNPVLGLNYIICLSGTFPSRN
jgi:microcystin-dependent protein